MIFNRFLYFDFYVDYSGHFETVPFKIDNCIQLSIFIGGLGNCLLQINY